MAHSRRVFSGFHLGGSARYAVALAIALLVPLNRTVPASGDTLVDVVDVEPVWAGHPVGFSLLTQPPHQYLAYYDAERQMTIAQRRLDQRTWTLTRLPTHVGWDSHNSVTMAIDGQGHLHVAGNMHCVPLIYFRSSRAWDASSLERMPQMVGPERERRVTYPVFLRGASGELIFRYRDGGSGQGDDLYNVFDEASQQWQRLIDGPLHSGQGKMNAYCTRPARGPQGWYHMVWVWRDTPDCATNHDLSYARSRDLAHWETVDGRSLSLPITIESPTEVDPTPPGGGLINGGHRLGFDLQDRPVIAYHRYDAEGHSQIFAARYEDGHWAIRQLSDWAPYRWDFHGGGSIPFGVRVGSVRSVRPNHLRIDAASTEGRDTWWLDADTMAPVSAPPVTTTPSAAGPAQDDTWRHRGSSRVRLAGPPDFPGLQPRSAADLGHAEDDSTVYRLHWYTRGPNRDRQPDGPIPPPVPLQLGVYRRR